MRKRGILARSCISPPPPRAPRLRLLLMSAYLRYPAKPSDTTEEDAKAQQLQTLIRNKSEKTMSLEPHGCATADGRQQQQSPTCSRSWSLARGTSDERQAAATSGGASTAANTHANSSALFNGAALLLDAATRAGGSSIHGLVDPMPTHTTITSKQEEAMTSKTKVMNKNVPPHTTTTMNFGNPTGAAIMIDGSSQHHDCHGMLVGNSGDPSSNKSSSNANGQLYATVHPGFWRMEGKGVPKGTANILVKIRIKVCAVGCYYLFNSNLSTQFIHS